MQAHLVRARYNLVSKTVELDVPGLGGTVDNRANTSLSVLSSLAARHSMPRESLGEYVKAIADRNAFSPVADWIRSRAWDGQDRLPAFFATIETDDDPLRDVLLRRWLIAAVAAVMKPSGFWCKGVLTIQGEQNLGKTSWFRALVPQELRHLIREGMHLDAQNRDCIVTAVSHWLVALGELEATLRRDMESLKAFITETSDRMRRPYDRVDSEYPRRTVFFASVNSDRFLKDATGNSRFWVLRCHHINHAHGLDMQQVWAQVYEQLYRHGEQWHLTQEEQSQLDRANGQFREVSPIEELIPHRFDLSVTPTTDLTATQVLLHLGYDKPSRAQQLDAGSALRNLNVACRILRGRTVYHLPLPKIGQGY
jgi:putative DNA primase/helicase